MKHIEIYTIGFTKKKAEYFFEKLKQAGVKRIVDVRLNNVSQLAGFAKKDDLIYFLRELGSMEYVHLPKLAPTKDILETYKRHKGDWATYERKFIELMEQRHIEDRVPKRILNKGCLLCHAVKTSRIVAIEDWLQNIFKRNGIEHQAGTS